MGGLYIKQESNKSLPSTCGGPEENERALVSVSGHMKIQLDKTLSDWFIAGGAARKCRHYITGGNNSPEINGSISQPSTPSLTVFGHLVAF